MSVPPHDISRDNAEGMSNDFPGSMLYAASGYSPTILKRSPSRWRRFYLKSAARFSLRLVVAPDSIPIVLRNAFRISTS
jgi:hypothetical protein